MKLAIIGSRMFNDFPLMEKVLEPYLLVENLLMVSGGARGADNFAEIWANKHGVSKHIIKAIWDDLSHSDAVIRFNRFGKKYDAMAGKRRNVEVVTMADEVVAFWDQRSPGTKHALDLAREQLKKVTIVPF